MNSCAASCCTCSPRASCASATSVSWPTADAPLCSRFAFNCSAPHKNRKPNRTSHPPMTRATFGAALNVVDRWSSSKDSRLQKSNFVLRHWSPLPHETTLSNSNPLRVWAGPVPLRFAAEQISSFNLLNAVSALLPPARQLPASSAVLYSTVRASFYTAVSSHSVSIGPASAATTRGFLLTA